MAEDGLTNLVNQIKKYLEFARRMRRRWLLISIFTGLGILGSMAVALTSTRIYQSRSMVAYKPSIDRSSLGWDGSGHLPENYLKQKVNQLTASNTLLLRVARELDLYPDMRKAVAPEVILEIMRNAISFNLVGNDSFWIAFEYKDQALAQQTTQRLVNEFIQGNIRDKLGAAKATQAFMEGEAAKVKEQLQEVEKRLAEFVSKNPEFQVDPATGLPRGAVTLAPSTGSSPVSGSGPRGRPTMLSIRANPELREALAEKGKLEADLVELSPQVNPRLARAQEELASARQTLDALRRKYTDRHPDVQRAVTYVQQMQQELVSAKQDQDRNSVKVNTIKQRIADLDLLIEKLSKPVRPTLKDRPRDTAKKDKTDTAGKTELADKKDKGESSGKTDKDGKSDKKDPDELISETARLEQRWYELTGERTVARAKYEQIQSQLQRSKLSTSIERKQAEKEFTIIDPANYPGKPIRPSRKKIVLAGSALGLMLGLGLAALLVLFDPRIYNADDLKKATNLPVLVQIPKEP